MKTYGKMNIHGKINCKGNTELKSKYGCFSSGMVVPKGIQKIYMDSIEYSYSMVGIIDRIRHTNNYQIRVKSW